MGLVAPTSSLLGEIADPAEANLSRLVSQIWRQPALDLSQRHLLAAGIVFHLITSDAVHSKIAGIGMGEIQAADAGGPLLTASASSR